MTVCTKDMKTVATYTEQPDAVQDQVVLVVQISKRVFADRMVYETKLSGCTSGADSIFAEKMICDAPFAESDFKSYYQGTVITAINNAKQIVEDFFKTSTEVITATEEEEL